LVFHLLAPRLNLGWLPGSIPFLLLLLLLLSLSLSLSLSSEDNGDFVVVLNSKLVAVTGRKRQQKVYRYHTGGPGGLKEIPFEEMMEEKPNQVLPSSPSPLLLGETWRLISGFFAAAWGR